MIQRYSLALSGSLIVTYLLLFLMSSLLQSRTEEPLVKEKNINLRFLRDTKPIEPPQQKVRDKLETVKTPPPAKKIRYPVTNTVGGTGAVILPPVGDPVKINPDDAKSAFGSPKMIVEPVYPIKARKFGIEGHVTLEFTVNRFGQVVDAVVIEAYPSDIFNRAAIKAILKSRFQPKIVDGKAVDMPGMQYRYYFQMNNSTNLKL